jgi:hypothetical protein
MKYVDRIRQAKSLQESLLVLAEGIDAVLDAQAAGPSTMGPESEWGDWPSSWQNEAAAVTTPQQDDPFGVTQVKVSPEELALARNVAHEAEIEFEQLAARGHADGQSAESWQAELQQARDFMWRCQAHVRQLEDPGAILNHAGEIPGQREALNTTEENGQVIVELPPADEARRAARLRLAEAIDLPGYFPVIYRSSPMRDELNKAYSVGGPLWLNAVGKFEGQPPVIMQLPPAVRTAMVEDVRQDSARIAFDLGRELFKDADPDTLDISGQNIQAVAERGGQVYTGKGDL